MTSFLPVSALFSLKSRFLFFLGFCAGLPLLLVFSTLSVWLREAGVDRASITYLSWVGLVYGFKFVWAPLLDSLKVPYLDKAFGQRKAWLLVFQICICISLVFISFSSPEQGSLGFLVGSILALAFFSASQDIQIDAYRIEIGTQEEQATLAAMYTTGYRLAMIVSGAGALSLVGIFSYTPEYDLQAWQTSYLVFAVVALITSLLTLVLLPVLKNKYIQEKQAQISGGPLVLHFVLMLLVFIGVYRGFSQFLMPESGSQLLLFFLGVVRISLSLVIALALGKLLTMSQFKLMSPEAIGRIYFEPIQKFFQSFGKLALALLFVVCFYKISDILLGVIANVFYLDMGYTKEQIAFYSKFYGLGATIVGGLLGGLLVLRFGIMPILAVGGILAASTNLLFAYLANQEASETLLFMVITLDNLSAGIATAAFIGFLSQLTNQKYTATQFATLSSLMLVLPKFIAGYSGALVDLHGYTSFFSFTAVVGIPVVVVIVYLRRFQSN